MKMLQEAHRTNKFVAQGCVWGWRRNESQIHVRIKLSF